MGSFRVIRIGLDVLQHFLDQMALSCEDAVEDTCDCGDEEDSESPSDDQPCCSFRHRVIDIFPDDFFGFWCFINLNVLSSLSKKLSQFTFLQLLPILQKIILGILTFHHYHCLLAWRLIVVDQIYLSIMFFL